MNPKPNPNLKPDTNPNPKTDPSHDSSVQQIILTLTPTPVQLTPTLVTPTAALALTATPPLQMTGFEDYLLWDDAPVLKHENVWRALVAVSAGSG